MDDRRSVIIAFLGVTVFITGSAAVLPLVVNIDSISSSRIPIRPAHINILNATWVTSTSGSTLEGITLRVNNTDTIAHNFTVTLQVMCTSSGAGPLFPPKPYSCAAASNSTGFLPPSSQRTITLNFNFAVDPTRTLINRITYIATEANTSTVSTGTISPP